MRNALNSLANEEHTTFIVTKHYHLTERLWAKEKIMNVEQNIVEERKSFDE